MTVSVSPFYSPRSRGVPPGDTAAELSGPFSPRRRVASDVRTLVFRANLPGISSFVVRLDRDLDAVTAGLTTDTSSQNRTAGTHHCTVASGPQRH